MTRSVCKWERMWWERQLRDLRAVRSGQGRGLRFSWRLGQRAVAWIEDFCKHHKGEWAGKPLILTKWERSVIRHAFGWLRANGTRRFRIIYIEIPRKNGKSEIASALGLYMLVGDDEPGAEVYCSATKEEQARIVWSTAAAMVRRSPDLREVVRPYHSSLIDAARDGVFRPLGANSKTLDGLNPHANIVDELHAHKDRGVWDVLDTAMGARRQPLTIAITTAGLFDPTSIGWEQHDYATKVLEGTFEDDSFFAYIAAADEGDDWFSEETQQKANPNWGVSVKPDYLAKQAEKAQRQPSFLNEYLRLHLNVWTSQAKRWLDITAWDKLTTPVDLDALAGRTCYGGLDLSSTSDTSSFVLAFPGDDGSILLVPWFWLPKDTVQAELQRGRAHYAQWERDGFLETTPGARIDYDFIEAKVVELSKRFNVAEIAYDRWGAERIRVRFEEHHGLRMVQFGQGYKDMSEPSKDLEARIVTGRLKHDGSPVLRWNVSNVTIQSDPAGNIKPNKETSTGKIDGVVASVMALSRANLNASDGALISFV